MLQIEGALLYYKLGQMLLQIGAALPGDALSKKKKLKFYIIFSRKLIIVLVVLTQKISLCQLFRLH